jgi:hypothetical protein
VNLKLVNCCFRGLRIPRHFGCSADCHTFFPAIGKSRNEVSVVIEKSNDHVAKEKKGRKR